MGLTKQYLRYIPAGNFNIIASSGCNVVFVTLEGQEGRFVGVGACEDIVVWDMRLGEKVTNKLQITLFYKHISLCNVCVSIFSL
jgi:hypothetical protein